MIRQTKLKMIWSKECIIEIRPYSFMGAGEEVNGRQFTLTLVVGMKLLQNSKTNSQEEKLHVNWGRGRTNWKYGRQVGTHKNILQPICFTSSDFDDISDMQLKLVSFATELHT